jgi:hypothetical protein
MTHEKEISENLGKKSGNHWGQLRRRNSGTKMFGRNIYA